MQKCRICSSVKGKILFRRKKRTFFICEECNVIFIVPQPSQDELRNYYNDKDYYKSWGSFDDARLIKKKTSSEWLKIIRRYKKDGKILEIGCAAGFFLEVAQEKGYDPYGVELSEISGEYAKRRFKEKVFIGAVEEARHPDESFDIISMFDLIEHIPYPEDIIKESFRLLKRDGIVAISTPNTNSLSHKLMRSRWTHYKAAEHLFYFSPCSISFLLKKYGFTPLQITAAAKALSLRYLESQFKVYPTPVIGYLTHLLHHLLPSCVNNYPFVLTAGEMLVIARKTEGYDA